MLCHATGVPGGGGGGGLNLLDRARQCSWQAELLADGPLAERHNVQRRPADEAPVCIQSRGAGSVRQAQRSGQLAAHGVKGAATSAGPLS